MDWLILNDKNQLTEIQNNSFDPKLKGVVLFKHSTRCSISTMALARIERTWSFSNNELPPYYLDLLNYRALSAEIANTFEIEHESPQLLIIKNGKCIFHASHSAINIGDIEALINT